MKIWFPLVLTGICFALGLDEINLVYSLIILITGTCLALYSAVAIAAQLRSSFPGDLLGVRRGVKTLRILLLIFLVIYGATWLITKSNIIFNSAVTLLVGNIMGWMVSHKLSP